MALVFSLLLALLSGTAGAQELPLIGLNRDRLDGPLPHPLTGTWLCTESSFRGHPPGPITLPYVLSGHGRVVYSVRLELPPSEAPYLILANNSAYTSATFRLDGVIVARQGVADPDPRLFQPSNLPVVFPVPPGQSILTVEVVNFAHHQTGILNPIHIGNTLTVQGYINRSKALEWAMIGFFFFFSLYHLFMNVLRRQRKDALLFGLLSLFLAIRVGSTGFRVFADILPLDYGTLRFLELGGWLLALPVAYSYLCQFQSRFTRRWIEVTLYVLSGALATFVLLAPTTEGSLAIYPGMLLTLIAILLFLYVVVRSVWHRQRGWIYISLGMGSLAITGIHDMLVSLEAFDNFYLLNFGLMAFVFLQAIHLLAEFLQSFAATEALNAQIVKFRQAMARFVPVEFLRMIQSQSYIDVSLGQRAERNTAVLFLDFRGFTRLSEKYDLEILVPLLQGYLRPLSDMIFNYRGFVDKFMGDGILAIFPSSPSDALTCAIQMQRTIAELNRTRREGNPRLKAGIGIHYGSVVFSVLGTESRLEPSILSDTVNVASRLQTLCKLFDSSILISQEAFFQIENFQEFSYRMISRTRIRGRKNPINVIEIFDCYHPKRTAAYRETVMDFELGLMGMLKGDFNVAEEHLLRVLDRNPKDKAALHFYQKAKQREYLLKQ